MSQDAARSLSLSSGNSVDSVGLGLWKIDRDKTAAMVRAAIEAGYRHFDAACDYGNEIETGQGFREAISDGLVRRDELHVTSKLWNTYHRPEHVRPACEKSLADLGLEQLDLYLVHFPIAQKFVPIEKRYPPGWFFDPEVDQPCIESDRVPLIDTWHAMEELVDAGLVKEIGVCNYGVSLLRDLINQARIKPAMLQVEMHPYLTQEKLLRFCHNEGIAVTAFSPLGAQSYFELNMASEHESLLQHSVVTEIAKEVDRTPAQVLLRWGVQRGTAVVPKTSKVERLKENLAIFDFTLSDAQMTGISGLDQGRRFNDPGDFGEAAFNTFFPIYE